LSAELNTIVLLALLDVNKEVAALSIFLPLPFIVTGFSTDAVIALNENS